MRKFNNYFYIRVKLQADSENFKNYLYKNIIINLKQLFTKVLSVLLVVMIKICQG